MSIDEKVRHDVEEELTWDTSVEADAVRVGVERGIVTLTGFVDTLGERDRVEAIALRVRGVRAVVDEVAVLDPSRETRTDTDVAERVVVVLRAHADLPDDRIRVRVTGGHVVLEGSVDTDFQRREALRTVRTLKGVRDATSHLRLRARAAAPGLHELIRAALWRNAELDAGAIAVDGSDTTVILRGEVPSWSARRAAEDVARSAPGVTEVRNELRVESRLTAAF